MNYRRDVDGLRAVAVLPVLLFHLDESFLSGGFVGVDIFFVISGFLIIGIMHREMQSGEFSIVDFYDRRIRRIMPAYAVVLFTTSIGAYFILLPEDFKIYGLSLISAVLSVSNLLFWRLTDGYFTPESQFFPLLHTWSLSVEEQFYLIIPFFMLLIFNKIGKHIVKILILMLLISLIISIYGAFEKPRSTFYLLPTRAWELLMGGVIAVGALKPPSSRLLSEIIGTISAILIILSITLFSSKTVFPGHMALVPCLGAAGLLWSGMCGPSKLPVVNRLLSTSLLVWFGLISYSLYLWHWPLIVFTNYISIEPLDYLDYTAVGLSAVMLAFITRHLVEIPFRRGDRIWPRRRFRFGALGAVVFLSCGGGLIMSQSDGFPNRFDTNVLEAAAYSKDHSNLRRKCLLNPNYARGFEDVCVLNEAASEAVVILADSHGMNIGHAFSEFAPDTRVVLAVTGNCPPAFRIPNPPGLRCDGHTKTMIDNVLQMEPTTIIITALYYEWERRPEFKDEFWLGFSEAMQKLSSHGHTLVILGPIPPHDGRYLPAALTAWTLRGNGIAEYKFAASPTEAQNIDTQLIKLSNQLGAMYVPLFGSFCSNESYHCHGVKDGTALYTDRHHITLSAARQVVRDLIGPTVFER